jgi:hypothetical protein
MHPAIPCTAILGIVILEAIALLTHQDGAILGMALTIIGGIAGFTLNTLIPTTKLQNTIRKAAQLKQPQDKPPA